jgi:hypothetical protein
MIDLKHYDFASDIYVRAEIEPVRVTALNCVINMWNKQTIKVEE